MILISSSSNDMTTSVVIDWIKMKTSTEVVRIDDDSNYSVRFVGKDIFIETKNFHFKLTEVNSYWYRRGRVRFKYEDSSLTSSQSEEQDVLEEYINRKLSDKITLGSYQQSDVNKLVLLEEAVSVGLLIPETFLFECFKDMADFDQDELVTKTYLQNSVHDVGSDTVAIYTNTVQIDNEELNFAPSLFQKKIEKKFELRIFYLNGKFWSMAIFSQQDRQTSVDFRRYNVEVPNRTVPFKLPFHIEAKLDQLMHRVNLKTGSIDMIVTDNNEFIFLEINPIGQFGMVSFPCNYYLEEKIANHLINGFPSS